MSPAIDYKHLLEHDLPTAFRVPGCASAILKDGQVVAQHTWGYANLATKVAVTPETIFPICSISKQMVCLILTELITERGPEFGDAIFKAVLDISPAEFASNKDFTLQRLVDMQSGARDYWALSVLWGASPQGRFSIYEDGSKAAKQLGGFHFGPGTQMSYANTNFMLVGRAIEKVTGETLSDLLQARVFEPAGMKTATLGPDTARIPPPVIGYEGSETVGYIPYSNRIEWSGDAGVLASLEDMIAYEKYIDRCSKDESSAYYKNAKQPKYIDGKPAYYGHGLMFEEVEGNTVIGHSGGLAGFRLRRLYIPSDRTSVILLYNSEVDLPAVVDYVLKKLIKPPTDSKPASTKLDVKWTGAYFDDEAKLAVVIKQDKQGEILVNYNGDDDKLDVQNEHEAKCTDMHVSLDGAGSNLTIHRPLENRKFTVRPLANTMGGDPVDPAKFIGTYYSGEVDSTFHVEGSGGVLYGSFDGYLGKGPAHVMRWLGENVWWLACFRSLDAPPPGQWTVSFDQSADGKSAVGVTVSNWLARKVQYKKV